MAKKITKKQAVLKHILTHKRGITPETAWTKYHVYRLADVIFKLKKDGYEIETIIEHSKDPYGPNSYARYVLKEAA